MIVVVDIGPVIAADVAKLVFASAGHLVAALVLLNDKLAFFALSVVQILLKVLNFVVVALTFMGEEEAMRTKDFVALNAGHFIF